MTLTLINNGDTGLVSRNKINAGLVMLNEIATISTGAIADGGSHPLSQRYSSLAEAKSVYPFVTSLSQEIDWAACQQASNIAFGPAGSENAGNTSLNLPLHITNGTYYFGSDTWVIRNLASARIYGDGQFVSTLTGDSIVLQFDGIWYSLLESFSIQTLQNTAITALDLDGNVPGHPYPTRGVQGVDLKQMSIIASGGKYAFAMVRQGGGGGQGSECSYIDVHLAGASESCYLQVGFNALNNVFIGGDFQAYPKDGANVQGGDCAFFKTSFESTYGYQQFLNDGWDIRCGDGGAFSCMPIHGCRTESIRFLHNGGSIYCDVRGVTQSYAGLTPWQANHLYNVGDVITVNYVQGDQNVIGEVFAVTVGGLSGNVQPVWPLTGAGGVVIDNAVTWTETQFNFIENTQGTVDMRTCKALIGRIVTRPKDLMIGITSNHVMGNDRIVFADASGGPITITLPYEWDASQIPVGDFVTIKKIDTTANAITVSSPAHGIENSPTYTIPGGSAGSVQMLYGVHPVNFVTMWNIVAKT